MGKIKWSFKKLEKFLKDYNFSLGHIEGSHYFYNGKIKGEQRVVQVILSRKERECQTKKTIEMAIKHSGIPKEYFEEWDKNGIVHKNIIS
jgi:predicted RNA binding protein YcfA (HicA-like mRNA interferase family)